MHYAQNQVALIKLQTLTLRGETRGNESASVGRGTKTLPFVINLGVCVCVCVCVSGSDLRSGASLM